MFNYRSPRAQLARFEIALRKFKFLLVALALILLIGGTFLILFGIPIGWLVIGLAGIFYMPVYWHKKELAQLTIKEGTIDGILSNSVLGQLSKNPTAGEIAKIVANCSSGRFILARFGFSSELLPGITATHQIDINAIWEMSAKLREQLGSPVIGAGVLILAIILLTPDHEQFLAQNKLDVNDLKDGVRWYDHVVINANLSKERIKTGGIARDWSFGYTPTLERFGRNISNEIAAHGGRTMSLALPSRKAIAEQIISIFAGGGRQNVAIIAPDGAGKTSVVHDFAEKILDANAPIPDNLKFRQVFLMNSSAIISAANDRGEIEGLMTRILNEAANAKNIIICLDDAQLFFEDGTGSVDISNLLLPILEGGRIRLLMTMNEQILLRIGAKNPALVNALNRVNIAPANYEETLAAMQDRVVQLEYDLGTFYQYRALKKAYELSERYIYDSAMPGRAIKLLESAGNYAINKIVTATSVENAIEKTLGVKVGVADDTAEKEKLLNLEDLIHERMIDQERAVKVVSDALRRARAGVRNTGRPVGTFLFLGPTGVGKTELAKAISEVYFNGEDNMVRVDLNQFVTAESVNELTADGADNPNSLTAGVMKKPFSVVLLDEIEKAHPNVLTALLQVLDEGILRDQKGREVSFRDAIIVMTSNAGALQIREKIQAGEDITKVSQDIQDMLVNSGELKPEFLNRFDEMVVFGPLSKENLFKVADLMIKGVNKTLAPQKVTVEITQDAKELLVEAGYDPRLGARPMRRVVQRVVENEVAKQMLRGTASSGSTVTITAEIVRENLAYAQN